MPWPIPRFMSVSSHMDEIMNTCEFHIQVLYDSTKDTNMTMKTCRSLCKSVACSPLRNRSPSISVRVPLSPSSRRGLRRRARGTGQLSNSSVTRCWDCLPLSWTVTGAVSARNRSASTTVNFKLVPEDDYARKPRVQLGMCAPHERTREKEGREETHRPRPRPTS